MQHLAAIKRCLAATAVAGLLGVGAAPAGAVVLVDRGLPGSNLNSGAGSDRSNVAWDFGGFGWMAGDDFTLPTAPSGKRWRIDSIKTYMILGSSTGLGAADNDSDTGDETGTLGDLYSNINLFLGSASSSTAPLVSSGSFTGAGSNATDNVNITINRVQYPGGGSELDYQGSSTNYISLFEVTFGNLGILGSSGEMFQFGVDALGPADAGSTFTYYFNHASNEALSGTAQDGSDGSIRVFNWDGVTPLASYDGTFSSDGPNGGSGWDKASDVNVQVSGELVDIPEPGILPLLLAGLAGLAAARRRANRRVSAHRGHAS